MNLSFNFTAIPLLLLIHIFLKVSQAELFTALVDISRGLNAEQELSDALIHYVSVEQSRLSRVYELARELADHSLITRQNKLEDYLSNPVNAFLLLKKFTLSWRQEVYELVERRENLDSLIKKISEIEDILPTEVDLTGSAEAILRLQATYLLDTKDLADGLSRPGLRSYTMSADDSFFIGKHAYEQGNHIYARHWLQETLVRMEQEKGSTPFNKTDVLDYLAFSFYKTGDYQAAKDRTEELLQYNPQHERAANNLVYFEELIKKQELEKSSGEKITLNEAVVEQSTEDKAYHDERRIYEALCRDENVKVPWAHKVHSKKVYCHYFVPHPFFFIGPIKEEVVYDDPRLIMWHDLIHTKEMEEIKELATPNLRRATVQNAVTGKLEFAHYRISKSAWLPYEMALVTMNINDRIRAITGLNIETAEDLQVVNYGVGGQYEPHFDFARKRERSAFEKKVGNRIATLIYYMSDIHSGGLTVFTEIGVKIRPVKGSAAFWWNLLPNGEGDERTRHAACPVLLGSKWVMNKWFHERGQEFARPCKLNQMARI